MHWKTNFLMSDYEKYNMIIYSLINEYIIILYLFMLNENMKILLKEYINYIRIIIYSNIL